MAGPRAEDGITGVLEAGGRVGRDLLDVDWAATPLGPPASWPQSLTSMVGVLVGSRFSMWMAWGPELTFFCNDAYRRDTLGEKYPWALGRPASEVWAEIWPEVGPRVETVMSTGEATWDEALMLFLERSGYTEETYHTFSYSPLRDDDGSIAGMLCVVSEDTERVIGERRLRTLRDLGADAASLRTEPEFLEIASRTLARSDQSLPFALVYLLEEDGRTVRLAASAGMPAGHGAAPPSLDPFDAAAVWPAGDALDGRLTIVDDLPGRFADLPSGGWSEPPLQAALVPLQQQGTTRPVGFLVTALNRYGAFDDDYRAFVTLVAGHLGAGLSSARAYDAERARAEALAELDRAKTAFFTNVSHELRTPLTLMLGPAEDALADADAPLAPDQRRRVEVVARNGQRMLKLVNTLLDFSRVESSAESARFEPVDLARYTNELASMFESATTRAGLTLDVQTADIGEPVFVDHEMWAKIVFNLLSNALKHTWEGGITVRVDGDGERARLAVTDTGIGIEPAEQTRLFDRFHRVLGARSRSHEGSGIGLALVAELSALHGGSVGVTSTPGRGSTFTVSVPLGTRHLPEAQVIAEPAESIAVERHARTSSPRRCGGSRRRPRAPRAAPAGRTARGCSSSTTTATCASTSPRSCRPTTPSRPHRTAPPRSSSPWPTRRTSC
jgi:signal transduction histidine kinase